MQLFFYLFGPGINPLWRRGSGTTDPAQVYSIKVLNEWSVKFVCFTRLKVTISMQIHTTKSQMSISTVFVYLTGRFNVEKYAETSEAGSESVVEKHLR